MKAVSLHAVLAKIARQRHQFGDCRLAAMKAGVEAGNLRHAGQALGDGFDGRQIVRLMQRRQRDQSMKFRREPPG